VARKPIEFNNPKIQIVTHYDYLNYKELLTIFGDSDACIWCLGISQTKVSKEEYIRITFDYAIAADKAML